MSLHPPLPTQPVTCIAYDQNGNPVAGARFRFKLNSTEIYNGFIAPEMVEVTANALGVAVVNLFPNALGSTGSLYSVRSWNPDTGKRYLDTFFTVPDSPSNLHQILTQEPYPPIDAAQAALTAAQSALALVTAQVGIAIDQAGIATEQAELADADRIATNADVSTVSGLVNNANVQAVGANLLGANTIGTVATNIASINTNAANIVAIQNASTNATNAANSASDAADDLVSIAAIFDNFDDRYLGAKASNPDKDNDGNTLLVGAIYFNTTANDTRFWNGSVWEAPEATASQAAAAALASANTATSQAGIATDKAVLTAADLVLTNADVVSAEADKVQTGLDRIATAADKVATNADVVLAEADKVQTGLDRIATAADVVLTGADVVLAEADKVQTGLDRIATAADKVATNADVVLAEADKVQTGLDAVATAADRVQTDLDRTAASGSASTASTQASNASTSASNAAASYDSFDDRYLGVKSSNPSLDNDGNALLQGALYFNNASDPKAMNVYNGATWVAAYASLEGAVTGVTGAAPIVSSGGTAPDISIPAATASEDGYATATQITKLDGIEAGAQVNTGTNSNTNTGDDATNSQYSGLAGSKQDALGFTAENVANKDTDTALAANSDTKYASQKAVKAYVDAVPAAPAETATTIGALIGGADDATPNNSDFVATSLTAAGILKKITWTNVKAFLKTYFDTLYPAGSGTSTNTNTGDQTGGTPAIVLGTANTAGSSTNFLRRDDTILAFDATAPTTTVFAASATAGSATVTARRDHAHALANLSGDITTSGSSATTIAANAVTYAKMQDISATSRVLGRITSGAGDPEELTGADVKTILGAISLTADVSGTLPVANGGTGITAGTSGGILGYTASGTLASSTALTASALVLGAGAGATPTPMGSLGSTTTVLHGNAAGAPTFAAVSLTADVSGTLPAANGGTGIANSSGMTVTGAGNHAYTRTLTAATNVTFPTTGTLAILGANTFTDNQTLNDYDLRTIRTASFHDQHSTATATGAITIDWTTAQNHRQTEPTGSITYTFTAPPGVCHLQLYIDSDGTSTAQTITWPGTVIWYGLTYAGVNNKRAVVNFWWDSTNYHATSMTQV